VVTKKQAMIDYLMLCVQEEDWHGVSDAANDIRVIVAKGQGDDVVNVDSGQ